MAESSVQSAVQWLGTLLVEESENLSGIQVKLEQLRDELDWMQCFLREADATRYVDLRIRRWVVQVQEIAYEAEDIVENLLYKLINHQDDHHTGKLSAMKNRLEKYVWVLRKAKAIHDANNDIETLRVKISTLTSRLQAYGIKITRSGTCLLMSNIYGVNVSDEEKMIGLDDRVKQVKALLMGEAGENRIVGIWGKSGVGKTTLARKVCYNQAIRKHFDRFAWFHVPRNCRISDLLRQLLGSLSTKTWDEISLMMHEELIKEVYEVQLEKKCLVILDNVWSSETWKGLKAAFPGDEDKGSRSKFLFTTQNRQVVEQIDKKAVIHAMKCLSYDESWELLQAKLNGGIQAHTVGSDGANKMMEMAKEMLKSCQGIPLAIIALGGLLARLKTLEERNTLLEHMNLLHNGKGHQQPYEKVLELCYYGLPYYLKNCFLHLGNFPEAFEIPVKQLCRMWVAEGIIAVTHEEVSRGESLEDFAEHCLNELLQRGMVQVTRRGLNGRIKTCCLHDFLRDLCLRISNEESFLGVIDTELDLVDKKVRRLAIYLGDKDEPISLPLVNPHLRSLLLFACVKGRQEVSYASIKGLCRDSQLLRVLDLEGIVISSKTLPREIGDLMYLRFLSLKDMLLAKVPSSIGSLRWLETLDLRVKLRPEIPNVLSRLEKLRYLYLPCNFTVKDSEKLRLDSLKYLLTLKNLNHFLVEDVLGTKSLRKVSVRYMPENEHLDFIEASPTIVFGLTIFRAVIGEDQVNPLQSYQNLIKLELKGCVSVPINTLQFPPNLKKLVLDFCGIQQDIMPKLERLPSLTSLCLDHQAYMGKRLICSASGLPQLAYFRLNGLKNLEELKVAPGAMPNLRRLEIKGCDRLTKVPNALPQQVLISHI